MNNFFCKGPDSNILGLWAIGFVSQLFISAVIQGKQIWLKLMGVLCSN